MNANDVEAAHKAILSEQQKLVESVRALEKVLEAACIKISRLAFHNSWWLDIGYGHIKEGANALINATSVNVSADMIEKLMNGKGDSNEGRKHGNEGSNS